MLEVRKECTVCVHLKYLVNELKDGYVEKDWPYCDKDRDMFRLHPCPKWAQTTKWGIGEMEIDS